LESSVIMVVLMITPGAYLVQRGIEANSVIVRTIANRPRE
jgi:hypothetical protein